MMLVYKQIKCIVVIVVAIVLVGLLVGCSTPKSYPYSVSFTFTGNSTFGPIAQTWTRNFEEKPEGFPDSLCALGAIASMRQLYEQELERSKKFVPDLNQLIPLTFNVDNGKTD